MEYPDPYAVLGIAPGASEVEIRAAYSAILYRLKSGGLAREEAQNLLDAARAAFKNLTETPASHKVPSSQTARDENSPQ